MRAISVLGNTKSDRYRKTHRVEPDGTGRKFTNLTWGDLRCESAGGVSRGRSSEDVCRKAGGAKGRRTTRVRSTGTYGRSGGEDSETEGRDNNGSYPDGEAEPNRWSRFGRDLRGSSQPSGIEGGRRCTMKRTRKR